MPAAATPRHLLAIDTSTHALSVGLTLPAAPGAPDLTARLWLHQGEGGAQASAQLIPAVLNLLANAHTGLGELDALVFGRGPGAFTGLRTAVAVVQGLAYGTRTPKHPQGLPVLGIDTLLAVAEEARHQQHSTKPHSDAPQACTITAVLDARMDEVYAATYFFPDRTLPQAQCLGGPWLCQPEQLTPLLSEAAQAGLLAGNVFELHSGRLPATAQPPQTAWPTAAALLRLAPSLLAQGHATLAADAQPLYVRDKVAQTTAERAQRA